MMKKNWRILIMVFGLFAGTVTIHGPLPAQPDMAIAMPTPTPTPVPLYEPYDLGLSPGQQLMPDMMSSDGLYGWIWNTVQPSASRNIRWTPETGYQTLPSPTGSVLNAVSENGVYRFFNQGSFTAWSIGTATDLKSLFAISPRMANYRPVESALANDGTAVFGFWTGEASKAVLLWSYRFPRVFTFLDDPEGKECSLAGVAASGRFIGVNRRFYSECTGNPPGVSCSFTNKGAVWRYIPQTAQWEQVPTPNGEEVADVNSIGLAATRGHVFSCISKAWLPRDGVLTAIHPMTAEVVGYRSYLENGATQITEEALRWSATGVRSRVIDLTKKSGGPNNYERIFKINSRGDLLAGNREGSFWHYWYLKYI